MVIRHDADFCLSSYYRMRFSESIVAQYKFNQKSCAFNPTLDWHSIRFNMVLVFADQSKHLLYFILR